jgi:hypothetical protein
MSKVSTLSQGAGILTLIDEQELDLDQVQMIRPYLVALAKGAKNGGLPNIESFRALAEGRAQIVVLKYVVDFDKLPCVPNNWKILPDSEQLSNRVKGVMEFDPSKIVLHLDEGQKEGKAIEGNMLRKSLKNVPVYGAQLLDFYLANSHLIPEEWKGKAVFFWGTIYRSSDNSLCVRYLYWNGMNWYWRNYWLDREWYYNLPATRSAS